MRPANFAFFFLALLICCTYFLFPSQALGQRAPVCDVTCGPDPTSPTYSGTFAARPRPNNVRGTATVLAPSSTNTTSGAPTLPGSESYGYAIPIVSLPGRNGLDVNLTLYYNSAVWTIDLVNGTATFNADHDFPSYGFHLGFGMIEAPPSGDTSYLLTELDGTKRELRLSSGTTYVSVDSSYLDWNTSNLVLRRKDGTQWTYQQVGTTTFYRPVKILDTNGNFISIAYSTASGADNQAISTTYSYDALNRLTQKSYSDGKTPTVKYGYDGVAPSGCSPPALAITNGIGRRTSMCDAAGSEAWSYDTMGRPLADERTTNGSTKAITKTTSYTYNLDGSINTLTNPSGRVITYTYNTAAHQVSAADNSGVSYATNAAYSPAGALASLTNGSAIVSTLYYNNRLQLCRISVKSAGSAPSGCSDTANVGNVLDYGYNFSLGTANNGNVTGIVNNRDNTRSQNFTYDALNRLATAATQATSGTNAWGLQFGYDAWGNLLTESVTQGSAPMLNVGVGTNNRVTGFCYDAAGNLLDQGACPSTSHTYAYNAENQMTATARVTYTYDGDGKRVSKSNGKLYWYGMGNDALDETDLKGNLTFEYVFFGGTRIARRDSPGNVDYYFADHLGTARVVTNASGAILDDSDFYPFGGERPIVSSSGNTYKFTGDERDSESSSDHTLFRQYSFPLGRWPMPDPFAGYLGNPQSLNRYAYVGNNPMNYFDPLGLEEFKTCLLDGVATSCGVVEKMINRGEAAVCPHDQCEPGTLIGADDLVYRYFPAGTYVSRYSESDGKISMDVALVDKGRYLPVGKASHSFWMGMLKGVSDFSAGAGDCLTGRCIPFVHSSLTEWIRALNGADSVVNKNGGVYLGGEITGGTVGAAIGALAAAQATVGLETKVALHGAHHAFEWLGGARLAHLQFIFWLAGQEGSDVSFRIPLPW